MKVDKISFLNFESEAFSNLLKSLSSSERDRACEIASYYLSLDGSLSFAFSLVCGTLAVRVFDGSDYSFVFPEPICENYNLGEAVDEIVRYASLEEIEPVFEAVGCDRIGLFFELGYRHVTADADSPGGESYRVSLKNECALTEIYPEAKNADIVLSRLSEEDLEGYARLCRDTENNKYWGYDYREDFEDVSDTYLLALAEQDFRLSAAMPFAVRRDGELIGEAVISSFDYKGGADLSIRILPEHQRKGYAKKVLAVLFEIAADIGLVCLRARVFLENIPSLALFSRDADDKREESGAVIFTYRLY